jgi:hypothetical protein
MKKKRVLRKWVVQLLGGLSFAIICVLTAEFESLLTQSIFILFGNLFISCFNIFSIYWKK